MPGLLMPLGVLSLILAGVPAVAPSAPATIPNPGCAGVPRLETDPPLDGVTDIAPTGVLRVGINTGNPNNASVDPESGRLRGVAVDLSCALAARLRVPLVFVAYPAIPVQLAGLAAHEYDLGFAFDPDLAPPAVRALRPHIFVPNAYVVSAGSAFRTSADVDAPHVVIAVAKGNSPDVFLTKTLKAATLRRVDTVSEALQLVANGGADAFAGSRAAGQAFISRTFPTGRVLSDDFMVAQLAMFVRADAASIGSRLDDFIVWAHDTGRTAAAISRANLAGALPARPTARPAL